MSESQLSEKRMLSDQEIVDRVKIASSLSTSKDPNIYNCAGFLLYALGENDSEKWIGPDSKDMSQILDKYSQTGKSAVYEVPLAEHARFIGIRYRITYPDGESFYRYSHFALTDPSDHSFLYERKETGGKVVRLDGIKAVQEFTVPLTIGGNTITPEVAYFS